MDFRPSRRMSYDPYEVPFTGPVRPSVMLDEDLCRGMWRWVDRWETLNHPAEFLAPVVDEERNLVALVRGDDLQWWLDHLNKLEP